MSVQVDGRGSQPETSAQGRLRTLMKQALDCVDAAVESVGADPEAALDDLVAARLLLVMALGVD